MTGTNFELVSEWRLTGPREQVWNQIAHPRDWPRWWPYVQTVEQIAPGDAQDVGAVHRFRWGSKLPYGFTLTMRTVKVERPSLLEAESTGDLSGTGQWQLTEENGATRVRYTWRVELAKPWMRALTFLAPVFAWNHHQVMRAGAEGLARHLGATLLEYRNVR